MKFSLVKQKYDPHRNFQLFSFAVLRISQASAKHPEQMKMANSKIKEPARNFIVYV
jgi:hypothetical protein